MFLTALFSTDNRCTPTSTETRKKKMSGKEMRCLSGMCQSSDNIWTELTCNHKQIHFNGIFVSASPRQKSSKFFPPRPLCRWHVEVRKTWFTHPRDEVWEIYTAPVCVCVDEAWDNRHLQAHLVNGRAWSRSTGGDASSNSRGVFVLWLCRTVRDYPF